jgi:flagellar basal-body rod protein FlgF/flagellar basal-body rod protein FlgG
MYSAASALVIASEQQEVIAYNLANTAVPGYRERGLVFESFDRVLGRTETPTGDIVGAHTVQAFHDFRPGAIQQTGNPLDLALDGADRFFILNGPNGPLYTRNGTFTRSAAGQLVSPGGYTLRTENGTLTFPPEARLEIADDGSVTADGQPVGTIGVVRFPNLRQLTAAGPTLYSAPADANPTPAPGRILTGARESSNVQPADAMVRLIIGSRYYDAAQRSLRSIAETLQLNTRPTG